MQHELLKSVVKNAGLMRQLIGSPAPATVSSHSSMRTAQPVERAIYIPRGRRELIEATGVQSTAPRENPPKRPITEESVTQNKVARIMKSSTEPNIPNVSSTSAPEVKPAPAKLATAGIYIPKAKREQMERDAAKEAAVGKNPAFNSASVSARTNTNRVSREERTPLSRLATASTNRTQKSSSTDSTSEPIASLSISDTTDHSSSDSITDTTVPSSTEAATSPSNIVNTTNAAAATTTKPKEIVRGGIYIPKGRRELNEKAPLPAPIARTTSNTNTATTTVTPPRARGSDEDSLSKHTVNNSNNSVFKSKTYSNWDDSSDEEDSTYTTNNTTNKTINNTNSSSTCPSYNPSTNSDDTLERALLITVPTELTDTARSNIIRPYQDKGATIKWYSDTQCILMFKSERIAIASIPPPGSSIFRVMRLKDVSGPQREELHSACREAFPQTKPERDSSVANRLIGAALGIRLPKPSASNTTSGASGGSSSGGRRAPSPVREDAWD